MNAGKDKSESQSKVDTTSAAPLRNKILFRETEEQKRARYCCERHINHAQEKLRDQTEWSGIIYFPST